MGVNFLVMGFAYSHRRGKAIPLEAWTGAEGSRSVRLPYYKTIDVCRWYVCQP